MFRVSRTVLRRTVPTQRTFAAKSASGSGGFSLVGADQTISQNRIYHKTHYLALGLVPVAFLAHPSALSMPLDVALSIVLPLHAHVSRSDSLS